MSVGQVDLQSRVGDDDSDPDDLPQQENNNEELVTAEDEGKDEGEENIGANNNPDVSDEDIDKIDKISQLWKVCTSMATKSTTSY